ncbi:hypothetical protein PG993_004083 [Apiospora rasikravindrae]|uniref:Apple domain-containing protein n=1 Tax=Apiospora rasikravindrae TaxID=990691 RepID=A0ABR1TE57_9PEZI
MQLHPLLVAGLGAVVAAAPSPLISNTSPVLSPQQSCDDIPALPVLQSLGDAAAASICNQLAPVQTQTAKSTTTLSETATVTATTDAQTTETTVVDGPTDISTETITVTATTTQPATSTAYTTGVVIPFLLTHNSQDDDGHRKDSGWSPGGVSGGSSGPTRKKKKRGDKCVVKPKPSNSASTTSSAPTSTASSDPVDALKGFADDVIAAACSCLTGAAPTATETITVTATVATAQQTVTTGTETVPATSTAPGLTTANTSTGAATATVTQTVATVTSADPNAPAATTTVVGSTTFTYKASFDNHCFPLQTIAQPSSVAAADGTFETGFQHCAAACLANPDCGELYINYPDPIDPRYGVNCYLGGYPDRPTNGQTFTGTWNGQSDFSCDRDFTYPLGVWYNRPDTQVTEQ